MRSPFRPDFIIGELPKTDPALVMSNMPGVRAVFYDIDQTKVGHLEPSLSEESLAFIGGIAEQGVGHQGFVSNALEERTERAEKLGEQARDYLHGQFNGRSPTFSVMTTAIAAETLDIPTWRASKPFPDSLRLAAWLARYSPQECAYFGDLYRDVLAARAAGFGKAVLVQPYGGSDIRGFKDAEHWIQNTILEQLGYQFGRNGNGNGHVNGNGVHPDGGAGRT